QKIKNEENRQSCSNENLVKFIVENLKYPTIARENGVEGVVIIGFIINKNGEVEAAKIIQNIGSGCGQAALKVVNALPKFVSGTVNNQPVDVYLELPITFSLPKAQWRLKKRKRQKDGN
ncbi:MAG: energy transducer TonB, partial [Saprospiraceae bacterium]